MFGTKPNANAAYVGMWNSTLAANVKQFLSLNRDPVDVTKDQLLQLYLVLYPFIASEFVHRSDLKLYIDTMKAEFDAKIEKLNTQIESMASAINLHTHPVAGAAASASVNPIITTTPKLESWTSLPEDGKFTLGEKPITESSAYSKVIRHRDPAMDNAGLSSKETPLSFQYAKILKLVPFDIAGAGDELIESDLFV